MRLLSRPWGSEIDPSTSNFGPNDCLLGLTSGPIGRDTPHVTLMHGSFQGTSQSLVLFPYPKRDHGLRPERKNFPIRPRKGQEPNDDERAGAAGMRRMNEVLARVQELEEALDDPANTWSRLREAWKRAEDEADPQMAEIVRQARKMQPILRDLKTRIRRVLRRHRELTPLDRVQEMDRASMVWLSRQPGRTVQERAGPAQRILATVRQENFDTLENRVLHSYSKLASAVAREWLREHPRASQSKRYKDVDQFRRMCRALAAELANLSVGVTEAGITPNYVLMQNRSYREVYDAWQRLLRRQMIEDDLWAWQAETWNDFAVLAITLAVDELEEAQLVAQSPIIWRAEAVNGRWFQQDRPTAVFWLRETNRIVEIQSRPEQPGTLLTAARAHVALKITDPQKHEISRRVAVWTPHAMERLDLVESARDALRLIVQLAQLANTEVFRHGLIMTPAHEVPQTHRETQGSAAVHAIGVGASGESLAEGMKAIREFVRSEIYRAAT